MNNGRKRVNKPATMRDVAVLAGVSQPTVSRVLNQTKTAIPVSEETRERVMAAIKELGYKPNVNARSLRTQKTQMIALLIADISNSFYQVIARSVQDVARSHDFDVLVANSDHLYENERHFCEAVTRRPVDGVIMIPQHLTNDDISAFIDQTSTPVTVLGKRIDHPEVDYVYVNDEQAVYDAVKWLITERGYQSLGFIGVPLDLPPGPRRLRGFKSALRDHGIEVDPDFMLEGDFTLEGGVKAVQQLIERGRVPSVLFASNDLMAIGALLTLQEAGYNVPSDVAIMGFDNIPESRIVRPALTTIAQDPGDIGRKLAEALFERIEGHTPIKRRMMRSTYELIIRDSA